MTKAATLRSRRDFQRVLKGGHRVRTGWGTVFVLVHPAPDEPARLGLAVPASVGGAVRRNRIKRRLRAAFSASKPPAGIDVVVRASGSAASRPFQELEKELSRAVAR